MLGCGRIRYDPRDDAVVDATAPDRDGPDGGSDARDGSDVAADRGDRSTDVSDADDAEVPDIVQPIFPWNGLATGSVHAATSLEPKLMWLPTPGATSYEIEIDDSCAASSFRACTFDSPELATSTSETTYRVPSALPVSLSAPVGRRYYWRVRACSAAGCSAFAEVRYLDVGRSAEDLNGDGYAELVVGADANGTGGEIYVYDGGASRNIAVTRTLTNPGPPLAAHFGSVVAMVGDLNADGFADFVSGDGFSGGGAEGAAWVYYGSATGIAAVPDVSLASPVGGFAYFGTSVAGAGDVDGDGFADLIIGASIQATPEDDEGNAFVFYGSATGVATVPELTIDNPNDDDDGWFGASAAGVGDVNGDGLADVVVGAHRQGAANEGAAYLFLGRTSRLVATPDQAFPSPVAISGGQFGLTATGAGDLDADGYADFAIGAPGRDETSPGKVFVYFGGASGVAVPTTLDSPSAIERFGGSIDGGDLDGDGDGDLVVGAVARLIDPAGKAFVYYGGASRIASTPDLTIDSPTPFDSVSSQFGRAVGAVGDIDGDGYVDLAIGAPSETSPELGEGAAFVYFGRASGIAAPPEIILDNPLDESNGFFGTSLALSWPSSAAPGCGRRGSRRRA